jgi:hypothetical protein
MSDIAHVISALKATGSSPASTYLLANIPIKEAQNRLQPHPGELQFESCHRSKFQGAQIRLSTPPSRRTWELGWPDTDIQELFSSLPRAADGSRKDARKRRFLVASLAR